MKKIINDMKQAGRVTLVSLLSAALLVVAGGFYLTNHAQASALSSIRATLTNSAPSATSSWTIQFVMPTLINESDTIVLDFDTLGTLDQFTLDPNLTATDIDLAEDTDGTPGSCTGTLTDEGLSSVTFNATSTFAVTVSTSTDTITFTATSTAGTYIAANACVIVEIGSIATSQATGTHFITNPAKVAAAGTADIYDVAVTFTGNAAADSGSALVAVIEGVAVTVSVDESLSFSIAGVASSSCTQGGTATAITTTTSTVPFGSSGLSAETFYKGCHDLTAATNGASGYTISVQENTSLLSASNTIPDTTCDAGTCTHVIAAGTINPWASATTTNGFGYTCSGTQCDASFTDGGAALGFGSFPCVGADAVCDPGTGSATSTTPITNSTSTSAQTNRIIYKMSFDTVQAAGDYSNTITYIATPTF